MRNIILFTILVAFTNLFANSADIYNKKFKTAKQGLYIENDIVFVVVDIQEKLKNGLYEGTGMLRRKVLIDKYLLSNQSTEVKTKNIIESNYIANIANPKNKKLSYNITEMQVLENGEANNSYRYVSAIKLNVLNEIKKNIEISTQSSISQMKLIKNKKLEILESEEYNDIEKIYLEFGAIESAHAYNNFDGLGYTYNLNSYIEVKDYVGFLNKMQRVNKFLNNNKLSDSLNIEKLLSSCPAHPVGLENLQKNLQAEKKDLSQLLIGLISKVNSKSTCNYENIIKRIKENIDNKQALNEYLQLLSLLSKIEIPETDSTILQYVKKSLGHVNISKNCNKLSNSNLEEAKSLFSAGKKLSLIIELLYLSAKESPANIENWSYLGAAMLAKGNNELAIIYLNQALFMNHNNISVKVNLSNAYSKLNFANLAKGMALDVLTDETKLKGYEIKICNKILNIK